MIRAYERGKVKPLMVEPAEKIEQGTTGSPGTGQGAQVERRPDPLRPQKRDTKAEIRAAIKEVADARAEPQKPDKPAPVSGTGGSAKPADTAKSSDQPRGGGGKFAAKATDGATETKTGEAGADKPAAAAEKISTTDKSTEAQAGTASKPAAPPGGWSQDAKSKWESLPTEVQAAVIKREQEISDGFKAKADELKRYQPIEQAIAPHRADYQKYGIASDAEAIQRLLQWRASIEQNPRMGITALARFFGVDLTQSAQPSGGASQQDQQTSGQTQPLDLRALTPALNQILSPIVNQVRALQTNVQQREQASIQGQLAEFAKTHPHFEKVKVGMGQLMALAAQSGADMTLEQAYQKAAWADDELRETMLREQKEADERERAKAATEAEKKRKEEAEARERDNQSRRAATVSPKSATPSSANGPARMAGRKPLGKSARDSILEAKAAVEGRA